MNGPTLLVASTGGHLAQLVDLAARIPGLDDAVWVTFDSDQARSALAGETVEYIPYIPPRGYRQIVRGVPAAISLIRRLRPGRVFSTGAGVALSYLPVARLHGADTYYIESATRADGPSQTGKILARVPGIRLCTQHPHLADGRWRCVGSVFDGFTAVDAPATDLRRVVVTVGTMQTYGFRRLIERLVEILDPATEVLWQTGVTDLDGLGIDGRVSVPAQELEDAMAAADLVISHAGTGTALTALQLGKRPLLVPRSAAHGEHVDDHQLQTASHLAALDLATVVRVEELTPERLREATAGSIERSASPPLLDLDGSR